MVIDVKTADGVDVEVGKTYYTEDGGEYVPTCVSINMYDSDKVNVTCWSYITDAWIKASDLYAAKPEPDSWERLEEDAAKSTCGYFDRLTNGCGECRAFESKSCDKLKAREIVARAKRLAGWWTMSKPQLTIDGLRLKPCPFCGGEPVINLLHEYVEVACGECHAYKLTPCKSWWREETREKMREAAISGWNSRAEVAE